MIDLHKQSGLPMLWDPAAKQIVFKEEAAGNSAPAPDVRRRRDIVEVLYDRRSADMDELYYIPGWPWKTIAGLSRRKGCATI